MGRLAERTIPNRWLSASRQVGPTLVEPEGTGESPQGSPSASGSRDMRQKAQLQAGDRLRWGRSTDAEGDGDVRRLLSHQPLRRIRLDRTFSIDGRPWTPKFCLPKPEKIGTLDLQKMARATRNQCPPRPEWAGRVQHPALSFNERTSIGSLSLPSRQLLFHAWIPLLHQLQIGFHLRGH
jgi:hypothetical protein